MKIEERVRIDRAAPGDARRLHDQVGEPSQLLGVTIGDHGRIVSLEHYGASADYARLYQEFGITAEAVAAAATDSIRSATH